MARMNSQSRSLQIIARQNGWDPTRIIGPVHQYPENRIEVGDSQRIPASINFDGTGTVSPPTPEGASPSRRTNGADPYAGKMKG